MCSAIRTRHRYVCWPHICMQFFPMVSFSQDCLSKSYTTSVSLGRKMSFWYTLQDRVRLLLRVRNHTIGFYTYCAFKWLHVVRPRCKSKYHDIVLRCVCPCHLAVGMFYGHQPKQWNGSSTVCTEKLRLKCFCITVRTNGRM